jgi:hypothetical protein
MDELMAGGGGTQSEQQQRNQERARIHRKGMDELMTGDGGKKSLTPTHEIDYKTVMRPPTPPRRRERLPSSPGKRSDRQLSAKQPMLNEKVAVTLQYDNHQPMLNENVAVTLQEDNCHTHEWGQDWSTMRI